MLFVPRLHNLHLFMLEPGSISSVCPCHSSYSCRGRLYTPTTTATPTILHSQKPPCSCLGQSSVAHNMGHVSPLFPSFAIEVMQFWPFLRVKTKFFFKLGSCTTKSFSTVKLELQAQGLLDNLHWNLLPWLSIANPFFSSLGSAKMG